MNACLNKALVVVLGSLLGDLDLGNFRVLFLLELFYHCVELFLALAILKQTTQFPETLQQSLSVRLLIFIQNLDFWLSLEYWVSQCYSTEDQCLCVKVLVHVCDKSHLKQKLTHVKIFLRIFCQYQLLFSISFFLPLVAHRFEKIQSCSVCKVET